MPTVLTTTLNYSLSLFATWVLLLLLLKKKKRKQLFFSLALTLANGSRLFCILSMQNKAIFVIKLQINKYLFFSSQNLKMFS